MSRKRASRSRSVTSPTTSETLKGRLMTTAQTVEWMRRSKLATASGTIHGSGSTLAASRKAPGLNGPGESSVQ